MRERHLSQESEVGRLRITPARAGKTGVTCSDPDCIWDHPRSCGKDVRFPARTAASSGSPPLVRERHQTGAGNHVAMRITPARAGKTVVAITIRYVPRDHPRSCGKDRIQGLFALGVEGSPPLVRERLDFLPLPCNLLRITPARAGKTITSTSPSMAFEDHPRSCGKDHIEESEKQTQWGSPPLVRERLCRQFKHFFIFGITPARAGKTPAFCRQICSIWDHPRSCGKDRDAAEILGNHMGSPPLVRERPLNHFDGHA